MIEDDLGFIWLAADKGLFRYNGKEYTNYSHPNKRGLSVFNLEQDRNGRIWCNNISGQFFYIENDSLHLFYDIKDKIKTTQLPVFTLDENDNVNISTDEGLYQVNFYSKEVDELVKIENNLLRIPPNIKRYNNDLFFLNDSISQFRSGKFYQAFPFKTRNTYSRFHSFNNDLYFISSWVKHYTSSEDNRTDFYTVDIDSRSLSKANAFKKLENKTIISVDEIDNRIWFNTNNGTYVYQIKKGTLVYEKSFYLDKYVTRVLKDKNENYWISTLKDGIFVIPNLSVTSLKLPPVIENVTSLSFAGDNLIYGTDKSSIVFYNLSTKVSEAIVLNNVMIVAKLAYNSAMNVLFICGDNNSFLCDLNTGKSVEIPELRSVKDMTASNNNSLLVSNHDGAYVLDYSNSKKSSVSTKGTPPLRFSNEVLIARKNIDVSFVRSYTSHYRKDSTMYVGQIDKLFFFDKTLSKSEIKYKENSISATDIVETEDSVIWVSTNENGIIGIRNNEALYNFDKSNGLISNQALKLAADGNNLWVVTNKGLLFFDRNNLSFKSFSFKNEIPIQKVTDIKVYRSKVYISGNSGVFVVDKSYLDSVKSAPKVYFESVIIGNREKELQKKYTISHSENSFETHFNANFYNSKESIVYLYRLRELEVDWKETNTGIVRYPSLPGGEYTFEVKALTNKGVESEEIQIIQLYITTPFWNQLWFYLIIGLLAFAYFRITIKRVRDKQKKKIENERISKELVFSQLENLRSQMNPHFIFNVLNSIQEYIVTNDKYTASIYLAEFSKLIRMYLDHSRLEQIQLSEEVKALKIYLELEENRFEDDFEYSIIGIENIDMEEVYIPSLFIQLYVENAIKHGLLHKDRNKKLSVRFEYNDINKILLCTITDNGIGRVESKKINEENKKYHTSFATEANSNRVDLLNKNRKRKIVVQMIDVYTKQSEPNGTKIIISIPQ